MQVVECLQIYYTVNNVILPIITLLCSFISKRVKKSLESICHLDSVLKFIR